MPAEPPLQIVRQYQSRYSGLVNYYMLASNLSIFGKLNFVMASSLLRTLACKHKSSLRKMLGKYKNTVQTPDGPRKCIQVIVNRPGKKSLTAQFGGISLKRRRCAVLRDHALITAIRPKELIRRLLAGVCELCCRKGDVEVHQIRKLSDLQRFRVLPNWAKLMLARHRKALVICPFCHAEVHAAKAYGLTRL